ADGHHLTGAARAEQIADGLLGLCRVFEVILAQPGIVVHLAEVIAARIGAQRDHDVFRRKPTGIAQGGGHSGAAGAPQHDAFAAGDGSGDVERLGIADANPVIDELAVERLWHEVLADAFYPPPPGRAAGEDRAFRIGPDDLDVGIAFLQVAGHAGDRAARADAGHEGRDAALGLLPDFRAGSAIMNFGISQVRELVGSPCTWDFAG